MAALSGYLRALLFLRRHRARPGMYRFGLGTAVALINGILLIRFLANLFIVIDLSLRRTSLDLGPFYCASLGLLGAYCVGVLPLSSYRYAHDVLYHTRLRMAPFSSSQKIKALTLDVFARPMTVAILTLSLLNTGIATFASTSPVAIAIPLLSFVAISVIGVSVVVGLVFTISLDPRDGEILEIVALVLITLSNPDVRLDGSLALLTFFMSRLPVWQSPLYVLFLPAIMLSGIAAGITLVKGIALLITWIAFVGTKPSGFGGKTGIRLALSIYVRRMRPWLWAVAYAFVLPAVVSPAGSPSTLGWFFFLLPAIACFGFVRFSAGLENEISDKLRYSLTKRHRIDLFGIPFLVHLFLAFVPLVVRAVARAVWSQSGI